MHSKQKCVTSPSTSDHLRSRDSFRKKGVLIGKRGVTVRLLQPNSKSSGGDRDTNTVLVSCLPSVRDAAQTRTAQSAALCLSDLDTAGLIIRDPTGAAHLHTTVLSKEVIKKPSNALEISNHLSPWLKFSFCFFAPFCVPCDAQVSQRKWILDSGQSCKINEKSSYPPPQNTLLLRTL